jgi:hypothetical protein
LFSQLEGQVFTRNSTAGLIVGAGLTLCVFIAPTGARAQTPINFSVVGGLSLPIGDLANSTELGLNLGFRGEGRRMATGWSLRGDVSYDRYSGRGTVDAYSYMALAGNLVHRSTNARTYQFGGLGLYSSRVAFVTSASDNTDTNLGVQMGLGADLSKDQRVFGEFGLTSAFTSGRSSVWFPVRVGLRF